MIPTTTRIKITQHRYYTTMLYAPYNDYIHKIWKTGDTEGVSFQEDEESFLSMYRKLRVLTKLRYVANGSNRKIDINMAHAPDTINWCLFSKFHTTGEIRLLFHRPGNKICRGIRIFKTLDGKLFWRMYLGWRNKGFESLFSSRGFDAWPAVQLLQRDELLEKFRWLSEISYWENVS